MKWNANIPPKRIKITKSIAQLHNSKPSKLLLFQCEYFLKGDERKCWLTYSVHFADSHFPSQVRAQTWGSQYCEKMRIFTVRKVQLTESRKSHYAACSGRFSNPSFENERQVRNDLFQNLWLVTITNIRTFVNYLSAENIILRRAWKSIDLLPLLFDKANR